MEKRRARTPASQRKSHTSPSPASAQSPVPHQNGEAARELPLRFNQVEVESLSSIAYKIRAEGFVPRRVLDEEFGPSSATKAVAILYRDYRLLIEVHRPWGEKGEEVLGYQWAGRRFSPREARKIPPELGFVMTIGAGTRPRYADYRTIEVRCRWTTPALGAFPVQTPEGEIIAFARDYVGVVFLPAYCVRAMTIQALPLIGKESGVAFHIRFASVRFSTAPKLEVVKHAIVRGHEGLGTKLCEAIPGGVEFTIRAAIPTSAITEAEFLQMLRSAGEFVRLSPGRSAGFGSFEVLEAH